MIFWFMMKYKCSCCGHEYNRSKNDGIWMGPLSRACAVLDMAPEFIACEKKNGIRSSDSFVGVIASQIMNFNSHAMETNPSVSNRRFACPGSVDRISGVFDYMSICAERD